MLKAQSLKPKTENMNLHLLPAWGNMGRLSEVEE